MIQKITQPINPGLSSQKYFKSKSPMRGLSSRPMKKSYRGFPLNDNKTNSEISEIYQKIVLYKLQMSIIQSNKNIKMNVSQKCT